MLLFNPAQTARRPLHEMFNSRTLEPSYGRHHNNIEFYYYNNVGLNNI